MRMPRVAVCYVEDDDGGSRSFQHCYRKMRDYDGARGRLIRREITATLHKAAGIAGARNEIARQVLAAADVDYALMIDTDMGFEDGALYRLLAVADPVNRPIVGGLCFAAWRTEVDGVGGWRTEPLPTIWQWSDDLDGGPGLKTMDVYPPDALFPVAATGAAFLLVHRSVFEALRSDWFTATTDPSGRTLGEDMSFCVRAGREGIPIHIHTGVRTTHHKRAWLSEVDYWRSYRPPSATEPVEVVPTSTPAYPFHASLLASTGLAALGNPDAPWLFLVPGDVTFGSGWLDHAEHIADVFRAKVVQGGEGLLVARSFAAEHGTDPDVLTKAAKDEHVFAVALGAEVTR